MKIAVVGCGALARTFYLPVLKNLSLTPEVLVDPDTKGIAELLQAYGINNRSAFLEEIASDIDAAIVASPNFLHFPQAKSLLQKGKHVLLEKPIASTEKEVNELINVAKSSSAILQPGMMRRFWKINRAVKNMLQDEILGKLQHVSMQEGSVFSWPVKSAAVFNPQQSLGGVFADTGSHTLDLLNWWVDDVDFDLDYEDDNHGGVEADCSLEVYFQNRKVQATIKLSRIRNLPNEFLLTGTKGWIKLKPWMNVFESSGRNIDKYIYQQYNLDELRRQTFPDLFAEQVSEWVNVLSNQALPVISAESVLPSIRMLEQGYKHRRQMVYSWN